MLQVKFNSLSDFQRSFGDIQSATQVERLAAAIKPYILRRLKVCVQCMLFGEVR